LVNPVTGKYQKSKKIYCGNEKINFLKNCENAMHPYEFNGFQIFCISKYALEFIAESYFSQMF
jgi:hypothetical protein